MPTSLYMPDVKVEIAFDSGFQTPAASRTWTDVSTYVELNQGLTIVVGRQDERSQADANQLQLVLDNRDGRFTPGRSSSPYYPNVKLDRPIRVKATPVDGSETVRFLGYINEWPVEWDGSDAMSYVAITASSRLSRLGVVAGLRSIVEQAILADSPSAYYTMGEPAGSTKAMDSSGQRADPLTPQGDPALPVTFGNATGPGTDSLTAVEFNGGINAQALVGPMPSGALSFGMFFLRTAGSSDKNNLFTVYSAAGAALVSASVDVGNLNVNGTIFSNVADGNTHSLHLVYNGASWTVYLDGSSLGTAAGSSPATGQTMWVGGLSTASGYGLGGPMAHVAAFPSALTASQALSHYTAGASGYAGETTSARVVRYAGYAGIPSAEISTETGQTTVQHVDTTDKQVVELMRTMEDTEGGVLFDHRDGTLTFQNRAHRLVLTSSYTLDMSKHQVEAGYVPKLDRFGLANDVTAVDISGRFTAHVLDSTSRTDYGVATAGLETASEDDDEPLFQASWLLYKYKQPTPRVPNLGVNALAQVGSTPNCSTIMATNLGDKITVSNRPTQDSSTTGTFFVEGYTEAYGTESLIFTFNVSPTSPDDQTLVIGDATRGVIGTNPVAL